MLCCLVLVHFSNAVASCIGDGNALNWIMGGILGAMGARNVH